MPLRSALVMVSTLAACVALAACATPRAVTAVQQETITLAVSADAVRAAAGQPELVLARTGVETWYYARGGGEAVSVSMLDGVVVAFDDRDKWPAEVEAAAAAADTPVSTGKVHIGMGEEDLRSALGPPNGITAEAGVETFHWLSSAWLGGFTVDSAVDLVDGKVTGFWDSPVSEYTQNLPTEGADRENATTGGRVRAGMERAKVQGLIGDADGKAGKDGVVTHRYESDPILIGDEIHYFVEYVDDTVVGFYEFNITRDQDMKAEEEEQRAAAAAQARTEEAESSILSFLANPLVQAALVDAVGGPVNVSSESTESHEQRTLEINGTTYTGGEFLGASCTLDAPCPDGYVCHLVTNSSGMCVQ